MDHTTFTRYYFFAQSDVNCNFTDTRAEFSSYFGRPCQEFLRSYEIDKNKISNGTYADGEVNANGYPLISTVWTYHICNTDKSSIQLTPWKQDTGVFFNGEKRLIYDAEGGEFNRGILEPNQCKEAGFETKLNSERRLHKGNLKAIARLQPQSRRKSSITCETNAKFRAKFEYNDDCNVQVCFSNS